MRALWPIDNEQDANKKQKHIKMFVIIYALYVWNVKFIEEIFTYWQLLAVWYTTFAAEFKK